MKLTVLPQYAKHARRFTEIVSILGKYGLATWINTPRPDEPDVFSASQADLQRLNQVCDSLLARVKELDPETMTKAGTVEREMDWPTGTDSLMPVETLSSNIRTSP